MKKETAIGIAAIVIAVIVCILAVPALKQYREDAQTAHCVAHMSMIDMAKEAWAVKHKAQTGTVVTWTDLAPYIDEDVPLKCPAGGDYILGPIDTDPRCTFGGKHKRTTN